MATSEEDVHGQQNAAQTLVVVRQYAVSVLFSSDIEESNGIIRTATATTVTDPSAYIRMKRSHDESSISCATLADVVSLLSLMLIRSESLTADRSIHIIDEVVDADAEGENGTSKAPDNCNRPGESITGMNIRNTPDPPETVCVYITGVSLSS